MKTIINKKKCKIITESIVIISLFMVMSLSAYADGETRLMQTVGVGERINLYISNLDSYTEATGQIGREMVDIVGFNANIAGRTVFLLDNSLSVSKKNLDKTKQIINQYVQKKLPDEKVSIATFGENVETYYVVDEVDASKISEALNNIAVDDKETYLTDALYDELLKYTDTEIYTRFVIVSDGVDNKVIGYTKEELTDYLKVNEFPIFSIGCKHNNNGESLKNMFAISRLTNANYYLLDDFESYDEIVNGLTEPVSCVEIIVPDVLRDGSTQNILLTFKTQSGDIEVKDEVSMPFEVKKDIPTTPEPTEEPQEQPTPELTSAPIETAQPLPSEEMPDIDNGGVDITKIGGIVLIGAGLLVLLLAKLKKNKTGEKSIKSIKRKKKVNVNSDFGLGENQVIDLPDDNKTVFWGDEPDDAKTVFLGGINNADAKVLVVRDVNNVGKVFRYPLRGRVIIGRKKDNDAYKDVNIIINYDPSISGRHLAVSMQGDRLYIEDLSSSNGTFINGQRISGIIPVATGCEIEIGRVHIILDVE